MSDKLRLLDLFEGKRHQLTILTVSVLAFLVLELLIYMAAAGQAGQKSRVIVTDPKTGGSVYEANGTALTSYERMVFENNHGPLQNYSVRIDTREVPFPFRAWISAAVGVPVGLALLVSFLVKVYLLLLYGDDRRAAEGEPGAPLETAGRFGSLFRRLHQVSVFHIGFAVLLCVLLLWMIPNAVEDFAKAGMAAVREYQWFFLGASVFVGGLIVWVIYLRYRLSRQMLDNQLDLEKFRAEKQYLLQCEQARLLPEAASETQEG